MLSIAALFNIVIKVKIRMNKFDTDEVNSDGGSGRAKKMEFFMTALVVVTSGASLAVLISGVITDPIVMRLIVSGNNCLTLPILFILTRPKIRKFIHVEFHRRFRSHQDLNVNRDPNVHSEATLATLTT